MAATVVPEQALFTPNVPGASHHKIVNPTGAPLAIKIKCSDNDLYRLRPVFAIVPGGGEVPLEVARAAGPAKQDKLVVQSLPCPDGASEAALPDVFKTGPAPASINLALIAADAPAAAPLAAPAENITEEQFTQFDNAVREAYPGAFAANLKSPTPAA